MLRVVLMTSNPAGNAARITHYLLRHHSTTLLIAGAVVDSGTTSDRRRQLRRLRAWYRHGGVSYLAWRIWLELPAARRAPRSNYQLSLHDLGRRYGFQVVDVPNINSHEAITSVHEMDADVGLSIGNRFIEERVFQLPARGTINLHHGAIPDYRGGPPAFWELYDGVPSMGVTVHRMGVQLDSGEILAESEVRVDEDDDPVSLMKKAHEVDYRLVAEALLVIAMGAEERTPPRVHSDNRVNTLPSRAELRTLERRLGRRVTHDAFRSAPLHECT